MRRSLFTLSLGLLLSVPCTRQADALTIVSFSPASVTIGVGESIDVQILGAVGVQNSLPVLGWGLDVTSSGAVIEILGPPQIGPLWIPVPSLDGDDLAGIAFPEGITGNPVLLATIRVRGIAPGASVLQFGITPMDLTEGFALDAAGFDRFSFLSATITVPEPPAALLLFLAIGAVARLRLTRPLSGGR